MSRSLLFARHPLVLFVLLAFGFSWGLYALATLIGLDLDQPLIVAAVSALFMFGPATAALITRKVTRTFTWKEAGVTFTGVQWKWVIGASLMACALVPLTMLFNWLFGNILHFAGFGHTALTTDMLIANLRKAFEHAGATSSKFNLEELAGAWWLVPGILIASVLMGIVAGCTVNLVFALGEEIGWRGAMLHFTRSRGLLGHVLPVGIIWGLWHAPLILHGHNYPQHPVAGVGFMCVLTTAMAVPLVWVRVRSRSIWAAGAFHGTVNAVAGTTTLFASNVDTIYGGVAGISGVCALVVLAALLILFDRGPKPILSVSP